MCTLSGSRQRVLWGSAGLFQKALAWQKMQLDIEAVECLVANLIYRGYVKGYISHAKKVLVLSKAMPFPHLKTVNLEDLF